jgi:predicted transposase YdaD
MAEPWDDSLKTFINENPQDFRRFHQMQDILRETRAYQEIIQEGKLEALHDALLKIVRERFPEMIEVMQKQIGGVVNPTTLEDLLVNISLAQNLQEALRALIALDKGEKKN